MNIRFARISEARTIHKIMLKAFSHNNDGIPSSALEETIDDIEFALKNGEKAMLCLQEKSLIGMIRFQENEDSVYFYRLAVLPTMQRQGVAKRLLVALEEYAKKENKTSIWCKVRLSMPNAISLYSSNGYTLVNEEVVTKPNNETVKIASMKKKI
ncbi:GNAT family N-acetyltransferase [Bacillus alkalicellulosilyticus]|uniref:GNAT family N-acetyltransferase n=1 Tax=Alkalihalobacterium alkalicellulosilyticum TaxID=1912214 RepID=UPI0009987C4A|nr:GNAT family N-acetyltransferase [Bacillus alkalicellulosilyticus]